MLPIIAYDEGCNVRDAAQKEGNRAMQRWQRWVGAGFAAVLLLILIGFAVSSRASGQRIILPSLAPVNTVQTSTLVTFNNAPLGVCHGEWETWNRVHEVCQYFQGIPEEGIAAGDLYERVYHDGTLYTRVNDAQVWLATPDQYYNPSRSLDEALFGVYFDPVITVMGTTPINGVPTTQYQFWSVDEGYNTAFGGQVVFDLFITDDMVVLQDQMSIRGVQMSAGIGDLVEVWSYFDYNTPIQITPPSGPQVEIFDMNVHAANWSAFHATVGFRR
jgi:hypothetical protein